MNPSNIKNPVLRYFVAGAPLAGLIGTLGFGLGVIQEDQATNTRAAIDMVSIQAPQLNAKTVESATSALNALATNPVGAKWNAYCLTQHSKPRYTYVGNDYVQATTDMPAVAACLNAKAKRAEEIGVTPAFTSTNGAIGGVAAGYATTLAALGLMLIVAKRLPQKNSAAKPE